MPGHHPVREDGTGMGPPLWWQRRRFGVMFHASLATVPGWAPIGADPAWYRAHTDPSVRDVLLLPSPLVETVAHHADRWAHVENFADFFPFLTFDEFDPDEWAGLARDAGMGYAVMVAKHHDGLCWWDAPGTDRTVLHDGPARNVLGEFAAACERADLVFGTSYSMLDWADERYPGCDYVDDVVHPQVLDLVHRYGTKMLWGDGHWGAGGDHWRSDQLVAAARAIAPEIIVNDRWWAADPDVRTLANSCAICHGTDGKPPRDGLDRLAGMRASEFIDEMREMQDDPTEGRLMSVIARGYSDAEIRAMAAYFAKLP